jgi:hypothetical protein
MRRHHQLPRYGLAVLRVGFIAAVLLYAAVILSADTNSNVVVDTNSTASEEIPKLRPPLPEIPPTFWERHQNGVLAGAIVLVLAAGLGIWYLTRPKPPVLISPLALAREALEPLRGQPETGAILSKVSQVVRYYFGARFGLPPGELTTTEFSRAVAGVTVLGPDLAASVSQFLRVCDERKFAPQPVQPPIGAVIQAAKLIDQAESQQSAATNRSAGASPASPPLMKQAGQSSGTHP